MKFKTFWPVMVALFALAGCDKDLPLVQPPMAVAPGYIQLDSGRKIQVFGYDLCPGGDFALIGHIESSNMEKHCAVVRKGAADFEIYVGTADGMVVERWRVLADTQSIKFARPNGEVVTVFRIVN